MSYRLINSYCQPTPFIVSDSSNVDIQWSETSKPFTDPSVFGPAVWFTLHNGAAHLPNDLSPVSLSRIKLFIDAIPDMLVVCESCSEHARNFIETHRQVINNITTGHEVFNFIVDFHNYVNERLNKGRMTYEQARKLYINGKAKVLKY